MMGCGDFLFRDHDGVPMGRDGVWYFWSLNNYLFWCLVFVGDHFVWGEVMLGDLSISKLFLWLLDILWRRSFLWDDVGKNDLYFNYLVSWVWLFDDVVWVAFFSIYCLDCIVWWCDMSCIFLIRCLGFIVFWYGEMFGKLDRHLFCIFFEMWWMMCTVCVRMMGWGNVFHYLWYGVYFSLCVGDSDNTCLRQ